MIDALQGIVQPRGFPALPSDWIAETETFPSGGVSLFAASYRRKSAGSHALFVVHGIGEHGGRYVHFPHYLQNAVDEVYCPDLRGHGRSEGLRGHVDRFSEFVEDTVVGLQRLNDRLKKKNGTSEIHLFGHSMGSLIALEAALAHTDLPIQSVILSSPLLAVKAKIPLYKKAAAGVLAKTWGSLQLANELDAGILSHDNEVVDAYQRDRLVHNKTTPKLYTGMVEATQRLMKQEDLSCAYPLLMQIPMGDLIVDPEASLKFYSKLKCDKKQVEQYPGFYHESFNETGKQKAFEDLAAWVGSINGNLSH